MTIRPEGTVIETERLWLREWREGDADRFRYIAADPEVMRFIGEGHPWTDADLDFFIARETKRFAEHGFCLWPLIYKDSGEMIGQCGLKQLGTSGMIEVGWWVAEKHWGQGLATEAGRAALEAGFGRFGLERIVAIANPGNRASVRIMEKLGMRHVRQLSCTELGMKRDQLVVLYEIHASQELASE